MQATDRISIRTTIQLKNEQLVQELNLREKKRSMAGVLKQYANMDFIGCLMVTEHIINHKEIKSFDKKVNNCLMRWKQQHEK